MSQKSTTTVDTEHGTLTRVDFARIDAGMSLYYRDGLSNQWVKLGTVQVAEKAEPKYESVPSTLRVTLDNGSHMTRRGWQSRRIWRAV